MYKKFFAALCSLVLFSGATFSQAACDAGKLSTLVDTYGSNPFSARTWRVLNGFGDPMIEPSSVGSDTWDNQQKWKTLVAGILPAGQAAHARQASDARVHDCLACGFKTPGDGQTFGVHELGG